MRENSHLPEGHILRGKRVAITGAGPAGLTLARLLQMRGVAVTVFERDASPDIRGQGGSLDLHADSGQRALTAAGLQAAFAAYSRPDGEHSRVLDRDGTLVADMRAEDEGGSRPEIDRSVLRAMLLRSLEPDTIVWGHWLIEARRSEADTVLLRFETEEVEADLVIGADGGWSKVRPLVSDLHRPSYSGATFVQSFISEADARHPDVAAFVGPGNVMALGGGNGLAGQRNGDGSIRVYAMLTVPEDWPHDGGIDFTDAAAARAALLAIFAGWSPAITELLHASDDRFEPWPLYVYPATQKWAARGDVTLLGDAAHIMPPFTGKGANYAMLDALELADALTGIGVRDVADAIATYERRMLRRMEGAIAETLASQALMLAPDAPNGVAQLVAEHADAMRVATKQSSSC